MPPSHYAPALPTLAPAPALAMVVNANTPYRLHLHKRLAREIPQLRLLSVFTHDVSNSPWVLKSPPEIGPVFFGTGELADNASRNLISEWKKGGRIIKYLRDNNAAAVVLHGYNDLGRLRILHYCNTSGIPVYLWADSNEKSDFVSGIKKFVKAMYVRYVIGKCTGMMPCGSLGRDYFVKYGGDPRRIYYCPYEPDYDQIALLPETLVREVASKFGLADGRRRIVYSGRLADVKRVDLLIRAFVALAGQRPGWDLVIVGDGPLRASLQALVPEELKHRVLFVGFQGEQAVVSAFYRNADVLCLPSSYEPWALVINEAAAAGLAIVASDVVGAAAELVVDGVNGKLFASKDLASCTAALAEVTDPANIDRLRAGSAGVLADWRRRGDPVNGIRSALTDIGVLG